MTTATETKKRVTERAANAAARLRSNCRLRHEKAKAVVALLLYPRQPLNINNLLRN